MKKVILILCISLSGCAGSGLLGTNSRKATLDHAVDLYRNGNDKAAVACLEEIVAKDRLEGVTDQALFRLSLISFSPGLEKESLEQTQKWLDTLQKEYPASPWTRMAAPLINVVNAIKDSQRQNRDLKVINQALVRENREMHSLKGHNQSLMKENKELRQTIEKLKHLDMELETSSRRR